jgi:integrase
MQAKLRAAKIACQSVVSRPLFQSFGSLTASLKLTIAAYLRGTWLPHIRTRVRPRPAQRYEQLLELHVVPVIGSVKLAMLQPAHVQQVVDTATTLRSSRTVAGVYRTLHAALRQAIRWQLLSVTPAAAIEPPRAGRAKLETPEAAKVAKVLDAARGRRQYVPLAILASTGLRRGELLALRWPDVELDRSQVLVFGGGLVPAS